MSLTTVSRGKPPEDWPVEIRKGGILLHHGVLNDASGRLIDVYCPERRVPCIDIDQSGFEELANRIASLCEGAGSKAGFKMGSGHADITAGISKIELHLEKEAISVRGAREFTGVPDSTWGDRIRFALIDAYAVMTISAAVELLLERSGVQARKGALSGMLRSKTYKTMVGYL